MGWMVEGPAVEVHAQGQVATVQVTSTSTVLLTPAAGVGGAARLRLYGVDDSAITRAVPATAGWARASSSCGSGSSVIAYVDSTGGPDFRFLIDRPGQVLATCVPSVVQNAAWPVRVGGAVRTPAMNVRYKDVTVLGLPDGTWLMVAMRYRMLAGTRDEPMPGSSVADVVAWRAPDPSFTRKLSGPYWLVSGEAALPQQSDSAWLGVPSAVVSGAGADLRLDVYYVWETDNKSGQSYLEAAIANPGAGLARTGGGAAQSGGGVPGGGRGGAQAGGAAQPPLAKGTGGTPQAPPPRGAGGAPPGGAPPQPAGSGAASAPAAGGVRAEGLAVKRFDWDLLQAQLSRPAPPEDRWETTGTLAGTLLGSVRVWAAADLPGLVSPFRSVYTRVRTVDPAPLACPGAPDLFFAAIDDLGPSGPRGPQAGQGIWRATGVPGGVSLCVGDLSGGCTPTPMVEGLDFVLPAGGMASRGRIATSATTALFLDPDPVRLPGGQVRVAMGNVETLGGLTAVGGGAADVCQPWTSAWQR